MLASLCLAIAPAASGDDEGLVPDDVELPPDIVELATNPMVSPDGAFPSPVPQRRLAPPTHSAWFFLLPAIGFWLILRRRGHGFRI